MATIKYGQKERDVVFRAPKRVIRVRVSKVTRRNPETGQVEVRWRAFSGKHRIVEQTFSALKLSVLQRIAALWDVEF
jgi:hypothetical protein